MAFESSPPTDPQEFRAYCQARGDRCDRTEAAQEELVGKLRELQLDLSSLAADVRQMARRFGDLDARVSELLVVLTPPKNGAPS